MPTQTEALVSQILDTIDSSIKRFDLFTPKIQVKIFEKIQVLLKDLQISNGRLLNVEQNIRAIGALKSEIEKIILNPQYIKEVADFTKAFSAVSTLQNQYFSSMVKDFSPRKVLNAIKKDAINSTVTSLTESGISANVTEGIQDILRRNITSGGQYTDLVEQMRDFITTNDKGLGALERYTRQITTDSLNQYSRNYNQAIASDLDLKWRRFTGSNLSTTREWCEAMGELEFYHVDDVSEILKGHVGNHSVKINPKTGLWYGAIPGTNADNLETNCGGYNCGHGIFACSEAMVPKHIVARHKGLKIETKPEEKKQGLLKEVQSKVDLEPVQKLSPTVNTKVFEALDNKVGFVFSKDVKGTFYSPSKNLIQIQDKPRYAKSKWMAENVIYHETGHAVHNQKNIVTFTNVDPKFKSVFNKCKDLLPEKKIDLHKAIEREMDKAGFDGNKDLEEQLLAAYDVLGSLTAGNYGGGHSASYYKNNNGNYAELFAHGSELTFSKNEAFERHMPEIAKLLKEYFGTIYSNL